MKYVYMNIIPGTFIRFYYAIILLWACLQTEMSFLEADRLPETSDDYERLVTSHPNNSSVWIQYILYFLMSADVKKAKAIAERALTVTAFE